VHTGTYKFLQMLCAACGPCEALCDVNRVARGDHMYEQRADVMLTRRWKHTYAHDDRFNKGKKSEHAIGRV
jgi:Fe-S oxidoreductase